MLQSALRRRKDLLQELKVRALSVDRNNRKGQVICLGWAVFSSLLVWSIEAGPANQGEVPESSMSSLATANKACTHFG